MNGVEAEHKPSRAELARAAYNRKKKQQRKESKRKKREQTGASAPAAAGGDAGAPADAAGAEEKPEVEYVVQREDQLADPAFEEFAKVFERFQSGGDAAAAQSEGVGAEDALNGKGDAEGEAGEEGGDGEKPLSKKKLKQLTRISVAALKRAVARPEVVEQWDAHAADPKLLVHLKSYRNAVPVPQHWSQKRAYLQGKRGVEKKPFQLPDFIAATGIEKIRAAVAEKDEKKKAKQKARDATRPKMNRIDLDYQVLHDAFFRYQTKPKMTKFGDLYYEGKENECHLRELLPGRLSLEARMALGMGEDPTSPPPWLQNMQRYGPPPSYPNLRIPGLNAPLPEGASYGNHPGGWGKVPVDETGAPLYGNPFGKPGSGGGEEIFGLDGKPVDTAAVWGEPESEEESEESEEEEEEEAGITEEEAARGTASVSSVDTGVETPASLQLRKRRADGTDTPAGTAVPPPPPPGGPKQLYSVLDQRAAHVGDAAFGSAHTYAMPAAPEVLGSAGPGPRAPKAKTGAVEVALDPAELEELDEDALRSRYEAQVQADKKAKARESFGDMVDDHEARKRRKQ